MFILDKKKVQVIGLNADEILEIVEDLCKRVIKEWEKSSGIVVAEYSVSFKNGLVSVRHCRSIENVVVTIYDRGVRDELDSTQFNEFFAGEEYEKLKDSLSKTDYYSSLVAAARRVGKGVM